MTWSVNDRCNSKSALQTEKRVLEGKYSFVRGRRGSEGKLETRRKQLKLSDKELVSKYSKPIGINQGSKTALKGQL